MKKTLFCLLIFPFLLSPVKAKTFNGIEDYSFGDKFENKAGTVPKDLGILGELYEVQNNDINYDKLFLYVNENDIVTGMLKVKQTPDKKICDLILRQRAKNIANENGLKIVSFDGGLRLSSDDSPQKNIAISCDTSNVLSVVFMDLKRINGG